jgi:hypothetical protein
MYTISTKLLTSKLGNALASKKLLSAILVISLAFGAIILALQLNSVSELATKSKTIDQQSQELQRYTTIVATQKQEIVDKAAQLQQLDAQIDILSSEIVSREEEISANSQEAESLSASLAAQQTDLKELQAQLHNLQAEIGLLQAKIQSNEKYIANLTGRMGLAQQGGRVQVSHYGLGVTEEDKGIVFPIEIEIVSLGSGSISLDVSDVQYESSFQNAVRTAAAVASEYTGESISDKDIIVRFINNNTAGEVVRVDGSSAGAVITAMMIAGLSDKELNPSVLVTGTIKPDGSISNVGGIEDKINAAAAFGAKMMLVPESQESKISGMLIVGVSNIKEVMKYLVVSS